MARPIVLSNGEMHVGLNKYGLVHDLYYPYVGLENHAAAQGLRHRIGVWVEDRISWLDDGGWNIRQGYPHGALIGHTVASNLEIGIVLEFDDAVDTDLNVFMRNIHVMNLSDKTRDIRIFLHQAFIIGDSRSNTDTAQYLPDTHAVLHYRGRRVFMVSAQTNDQYFDQHSIGLFGIEGREGTWRDADDGELGNSNVEHGRVDSTLRIKLLLNPHDSVRVSYWLAAGTSIRETLYAFRQVQRIGISSRLLNTQKWWSKWLVPAVAASEKIDPSYRRNFINSMMIIKAHIDNRGAVIASTDSTLLHQWRDAYAYCWPRDGAYVIWPLVRLGYYEEPIKFFEFCQRNLHPGGYLMHKYRADGALGSSWHPYVHENGPAAPPIQQDETALVLFVFAQFVMTHKNDSLLEKFYDSFVVAMANFLAEFVDPLTKLPKPSYDLWEEKYATTTYTTSVVYGALMAAADLADSYNDSENAVRWRMSAEEMKSAAVHHLINPETGGLIKGYVRTEGDEKIVDETTDMSSVFGAYMFGLFDHGSDELEKAFSVAMDDLGSNRPGLPRYQNDNYMRSDGADSNSWFVTALWAAQYWLDNDQDGKAKEVLDWVNGFTLESGVMSEQISPDGKSLLSVAPLVWSHAEFVATLLDTARSKK